eukprot:scaffold38345_cov18-Tisochrysis_lutea.AAC.1
MNPPRTQWLAPLGSSAPTGCGSEAAEPGSAKFVSANEGGKNSIYSSVSWGVLMKSMLWHSKMVAMSILAACEWLAVTTLPSHNHSFA